MTSLENVKVGDVLAVSDNTSEYLETVERITATLVITKIHRFNKKSGFSQGHSLWNKWFARPATDEDIAKDKHKRLVRKCENIDFKSLTDTQLEDILKIANKE